MKGSHQISLIRMRKLHLPHKPEKLDMAADPANQMEILIPLGVGEDQDQGTHVPLQTTQMCLTGSHRHHHLVIETGV